ncbi:MAG: hypothetical protein AAF694_26765 [Bacteroidota bacterium]
MHRGFLGIVLLGFVSCTSPNAIEEVQFPNACWTLTDTLSWKPQAESELNPALFVEFTDDYAYRNLFVKVWVEKPDGVLQDTLWQAMVVDSMGYWIPPVGRNERVRYIFPQSLWHGGEKPNRITVVQYMRDSVLCGVERVGIVLGEGLP